MKISNYFTLDLHWFEVSFSFNFNINKKENK